LAQNQNYQVGSDLALAPVGKWSGGSYGYLRQGTGARPPAGQSRGQTPWQRRGVNPSGGDRRRRPFEKAHACVVRSDRAGSFVDFTSSPAGRDGSLAVNEHNIFSLSFVFVSQPTTNNQQY